MIATDTLVYSYILPLLRLSLEESENCVKSAKLTLILAYLSLFQKWTPGTPPSSLARVQQTAIAGLPSHLLQNKSAIASNNVFKKKTTEQISQIKNAITLTNQMLSNVAITHAINNITVTHIH